MDFPSKDAECDDDWESNMTTVFSVRCPQEAQFEKYQ